MTSNWNNKNRKVIGLLGGPMYCPPVQCSSVHKLLILKILHGACNGRITQAPPPCPLPKMPYSLEPVNMLPHVAKQTLQMHLCQELDIGK